VSIRFTHQYFSPDISSVSQVISQIAFSLAAAGEKVSVICSRNRYDGKRSSQLPSSEQINGVDVTRCWGPSFGRESSFLGRILDMGSFCILSALRGLFGPPADTLVFLTNPPFYSLMGTLIRKFRGGRFVYILMDVYPDIMVRAGVLKEGGLAARILGGIARVPLRAADVVVVLGEDMKDVVIREGARPEKVVTIRNWADPEKVFPVGHDVNRFRREWGLEGKFVVEYSGNLGVSHSFEDLLAVAEELADRDDIRFLFIGGGVRFREVEREVLRRGLRNVVMRPYQDSSDLAQSLSVGDLHYVSLRNGFEGLVVPSKAYGIMAAGRPMIYQGNEGGEIARMIAREQCGLIVSEGDRAKLREGILRLYRDREMAARMGMLARRALEDRYSATIGLAHYRKVLAGPN
jgi:glycosyltransferase involved in cell wall biosynthesis